MVRCPTLVIAALAIASAGVRGVRERRAESHVDAGVQSSGHAGQVRQGGSAQDRAARGEERARAGAGDLRRQRVLRPARAVAGVDRQRLAGVVRRAPGEPARGPVGAEPRQGGQGDAPAGVRLLPRLPDQQEHRASLQPRTGLEGRVRQAVGPRGCGRGSTRRDRGGAQAGRQGGARGALARRRRRDRLRDLGLQRARRRRPARRARLRRRRELRCGAHRPGGAADARRLLEPGRQPVASVRRPAFLHTTLASTAPPAASRRFWRPTSRCRSARPSSCRLR